MTTTRGAGPARSRGRFVNTAAGPTLTPIDIGHADYVALLDPDTAFWALVRRDRLAEELAGGRLVSRYRAARGRLAREMRLLRFGLTPSAVYFNPTERCNLDCGYCYIPRRMRRSGVQMSADQLLAALERLKVHFARTMGRGRRPQIVFHGAEPMLARDAVFAGIDAFARDFRFGIQTNATLLDESAVRFLTDRGVSVGISLDGATAAVADRARTTWAGRGVFREVVGAMDRLAGYDRWSVISTVTKANLSGLSRLVEFLHARRVPTCLLNLVRCTLSPSRRLKPPDAAAADFFLAALDRTYELYQQTGRRLVVANFANILLAILAPTARRLMCDISPCGGGRCFFAVAGNGDIFPCSEFVGVEAFRGGNLFRDDLAAVLSSKPFAAVTGRAVEQIEPCRRCAIRHFCGAPCPAEAHQLGGRLDVPGAFCEFYEQQIRYAFRLIADGRQDAFLWPGWDKDTRQTFRLD